jgi:hypothetical protein
LYDVLGEKRLVVQEEVGEQRAPTQGPTSFGGKCFLVIHPSPSVEWTIELWLKGQLFEELQTLIINDGFQ